MADEENFWLGQLRCADGYYECPKDPNGNRLGPLVGYAGTYLDMEAGEQKHFVGEVYCNFAQLEQYPNQLQLVAGGLEEKIWRPSRIIGGRDPHGLSPNLFIGMPMGGIMLATRLGGESNVRTIFAEKKGDELVVTRHEIKAGDQVVIVEDVCNNFSTTAKAIQLIVAAKATCLAIACFLNRSPETVYEVVGPNIAFGLADAKIPVISLVHKPFLQYHQDDPAVAADVMAGNVVWKPKHDWARLKAAMEVAKS